MLIPKPPLTPLSVKTRQIAFNTLSLFKRDSFTFAFPGFFDRDPEAKPNPSGNLLEEQPLLFFDVNAQFPNARRHAGDFFGFLGSRPSDLPRQRYSALTSPDGTDRGLLRNELLAYADFEATGGFALLDALLESERTVFSPDAPEWNALFLVVGKGSNAKFLKKVTGEDIDPELLANPIMTSLEAEFSEFSAEQVLDLRKPEARAWFYDAFSDFGRLSGLLDPMLAEALVHERPPGPSFEYMLPTLCSTPRGGEWQNQITGIVMRRLGIDALVFPSARCDPEVEIKDGEMVNWRGWNVVDYRGAPPPIDIEESGILIDLAAALGPEGLKLKLNTKEINRFKQAILRLDPFWADTNRAVMKIGRFNEGSHAGSLTVDGLDDAVNAVWFKALNGGDPSMRSGT